MSSDEWETPQWLFEKLKEELLRLKSKIEKMPTEDDPREFIEWSFVESIVDNYYRYKSSHYGYACDEWVQDQVDTVHSRCKKFLVKDEVK